MKYRYSRKLGNPDCKHEWGNPIGHDKTQYCKKCGHWRVPKLEGIMKRKFKIIKIQKLSYVAPEVEE